MRVRVFVRVCVSVLASAHCCISVCVCVRVCVCARAHKCIRYVHVCMLARVVIVECVRVPKRVAAGRQLLATAVRYTRDSCGLEQAFASDTQTARLPAQLRW